MIMPKLRRFFMIISVSSNDEPLFEGAPFFWYSYDAVIFSCYDERSTKIVKCLFTVNKYDQFNRSQLRQQIIYIRCCLFYTIYARVHRLFYFLGRRGGGGGRGSLIKDILTTKWKIHTSKMCILSKNKN